MKIIICKNLLYGLLSIIIILGLTACSKTEVKSKQAPKYTRDTHSSFTSLQSNLGTEYFTKAFPSEGDKLNANNEGAKFADPSVPQRERNYDVVNTNRHSNYDLVSSNRPYPGIEGYVNPKAAVKSSQMDLEHPDFVKSEFKLGNPFRKPGMDLEEHGEKTFKAPVQMKRSDPIDEEGFENPVFIHKDEKSKPAPQESEEDQNRPAPMPKINLNGEVERDIETFIAQFDNAKDKAERTQVLQKGRERLAIEAKKLAEEVENELKELLFAKEVAIKTNNVLTNYHQKMKKDELSKLKLADSITIKKILGDKIHRELQGFRTGKNEYRELEIINPEDVTRVIQNIKMKLGE